MFEHIIQALPGEKTARFNFIPSRQTCITIASGLVIGFLLLGFIAGIWYFFAASDAANWTLL
ncbi:MAG: hypothetical protein RL292_87 [Candidatus Parcubacteria bacterium]|jgi:hypothetical protein